MPKKTHRNLDRVQRHEELRALMGHTDIQTTLRYQKVTFSRAESFAKKALLSHD